jgi:transcriptional regulator with XRE-family HTH domain
MSSLKPSVMTFPPECTVALIELGARIRYQRQASNWTISDMASRLFCSKPTYMALEAGKPTVSIGILIKALWVLGLADGIQELCPLTIGEPSNRRIRSRRENSLNIKGDELDF